MNCPICNALDVKKFLHIKMPILLRSLPYEEAVNVPVEELIVYNCNSCYTGFNLTPLNNSITNNIYLDYSGYISPFNNIGTNKFNNIIQVIKFFIPLEAPITEIGCGDGYLLYLLKKEGYLDTLGFEPSKLANIGIKHNLKIVNTFFRSEELRKYNRAHTNFILSHFLEHLNNPVALLKELKDFLCGNCFIIIEVPYFDGFYHEHLFFYTKKSFLQLEEKAGLKLLYLNPVFNNEYEVLIAVFSNSNNETEKYSIDKEESYLNFKMLMEKRRNRIFKGFQVLEEKIKHYNNILIWGAGSSAVLYLNNIKKEIFENKNIRIVSRDERHEGNFIPGLLKPVENPVKYENRFFDLIVVLSQFYEEIRENIYNLNIKSNDLIWIY
jgi:hypothetical protein